MSFFLSKPKVPKVSAENIEVLKDITFENQTPPHENYIAEDASSIISKLLEDLIEKVREPEVNKPNTHDRIDMIDQNEKLMGALGYNFVQATHLIYKV